MRFLFENWGIWNGLLIALVVYQEAPIIEFTSYLYPTTFMEYAIVSHIMALCYCLYFKVKKDFIFNVLF